MANSPYTLFTLAAAGPSLTAGTAASMLVAASPAAGQLRTTIPANWVGYGTMISFDASGVITTAGTPGTGLWDLRMGSVVAATTQAMTFTASASAWPWALHLDVVCRSVGATTAATFYYTGYIVSPASATTATIVPVTPGTGTGFDSTVPNVFDAFFTESLGTATLVCNQARAVIWNPNY